MTSHIMNRKITDNNAKNNIQSNQQIDTAFNSEKPYVVPKQKPDSPTITKSEIKYDGLRSSATNGQEDDTNIYIYTLKPYLETITNYGRKVCILSDSMSKDIK